MASNELLSLLEYIEQERSISREELIDALEKSLVSAGKKSFPFGKNLTVNVNKFTGKISAFVEFDVIDGKTGGECMNLSEALAIDPEAKIGSTIVKEIPQKEFGRIAAQTAKQTMLQLLRKAEKNRVFQDFKDSLGNIVSGTVRRFEAGSVIVDFQKAEGILSYRDKVQGDSFVQGDRMNALLVEINTSGSGPSLILSRTNKNFLKKLFEREVTEIADGTVEIKSIARDPGSRAKVSVVSNNPRVDPVGACIGVRGSRVKNITNELCGEKIDIIRYDDNMTQYVINSMQPAVPKTVQIDDVNGVVNVYVERDQVKLAIGRNWQNARLCGQLLGMKVNVVPIEEDEKDEEGVFKKKIREAVESMASLLGVSQETAEKLVNNGILSIDGLKAAGKEDLLNVPDLTEDDVQKIFEAVEKVNGSSSEERQSVTIESQSE